MAKQAVIILDNPPLESDPWASEVFQRGNFKPVHNEAVAQAMSKDPKAQKALLEVGDPVRNAEKLAPHYKRALDQLHGEEPRIGLYGTAWLVYQKPIDACIVDWSEVERRAKANTPAGTPVTGGPGEQFRQLSHEFIRSRAKKFLTPDRFLELAPGLPQKEKVEKTLEFLKKLGLIAK